MMRILLMYSPSNAHLQTLKNLSQNIKIDIAHDLKSAQRLIKNAEVVLGNRFLLQSLPYGNSLKWIQSNSVGIEWLLNSEDLSDGVIITSAKGVYDREIAEHAVALILSLSRNLHLSRDYQQEKKWKRFSLKTLYKKKCLILGFGNIGRKINHYLKIFGVKCLGVSSRAQIGDQLILKRDQWKKQLSIADFLVLALPLTSQTNKIIGEKELSLLPSRAYVINVGRGDTLDENALLTSLQKKSIAGAALDVFETEPLSKNSPLWDERNVIITPHQARSQENPPYAFEALFERNLVRYINNEPLLNQINRTMGY